MTAALPAPLVPAEVDLTNLPYMPIMIARLKQSRAWLVCKRRPELAFYMLNLWTASWHARPAASLELDDDVLADLAMCQPLAWKKVKADVLRGWIECSDGRLYHPVVVEQALSSWEKKVAHRNKMEAARAAKEARRLLQQRGRPSNPSMGADEDSYDSSMEASMIDAYEEPIIEPAKDADIGLKVREGKVRDTSVLTDGPADLDASGSPPFRSVIDQPPLRLVASAAPEPPDPDDPSVARRELYARAEVVAGPGFGGQVTRLLKRKGGNVALARAAVETASTAYKPREYLARIIRGDDTGMPPGQLYDRSI
ncbi:MAG: DUF1376 domain-containing protein [Janthinobacterium lividum]